MSSTRDDGDQVGAATPARADGACVALGEGVGRISCRAVQSCTEVTVVEDATKGSALLVPKPVRDLVLERRNREALSRLALLVERAGAHAT